MSSILKNFCSGFQAVSQNLLLCLQHAAWRALVSLAALQDRQDSLRFVTQQMSTAGSSFHHSQLAVHTHGLLHSPTLLKASRSSAISSSEKCTVDAMLRLFKVQVCKRKAHMLMGCFLGLVSIMKKRDFHYRKILFLFFFFELEAWIGILSAVENQFLPAS